MIDMENFQKYVDACTVKTIKCKHQQLTHVLCGLSSETGEVLGIAQKAIRDGKTISRRDMSNELGDLLWYHAAVMNHFGLNYEDVIKENIQKLTDRGYYRPTKEDKL